MLRADGRKCDDLRPWSIERNVLAHAEGSALITAGKTKILCAASVERKVPPFLKDQDQGWVTAEYSMLPRSTHTRSPRERGGRVGGRTMEIQRLIGRSLRCVTNLQALPELTVTVDCDVIQADGGTRTAAITGGWVALNDALAALVRKGDIATNPVTDSVAAVSIGMVNGEIMLDLDYGEDFMADVDMNLVATGGGKLVEVQATAEGDPFSLAGLTSLIELAQSGLKSIVALQSHIDAGSQ
jgi:ribonuclease PH